jgi:hypothetical protein
MPVTVRKRKAGESGKAWKIVGPTGVIEGESDTERQAKISASYRNAAHKKKAGRKK